MGSVMDLEQVLQQSVAKGDVPGVVAAAADKSGGFYEGAFGHHSVGSDSRITTDTVFRIASMTKAITAAAAMQMVEQGRIGLDQPAGEILPYMLNPQVLEGFDENGKPMLRPARGTITLRRLLTHTAGFVYDVWNENMARYVAQSGVPAPRSGKLASLNAPLGFDPGERWEYGINIDQAGRMVEVVSGQDLETYLQRHILGPLGMRDTSFLPQPEWTGRVAGVHARQGDGSLKLLDTPLPTARPEFFPGGGGLFSTAPDFLTFLLALMNGGAWQGQRILRPETVALMAENHMGPLDVRVLPSFAPLASNTIDLFPGMQKKWGLSFLINTETASTGRSAGSLAWGGLYNTYYWLDPTKRIAGLLMTQILPFVDQRVLNLLDQFETQVYQVAS